VRDPITRSPAVSQRASGAAWIRAESLRRRGARWETIAQSAEYSSARARRVSSGIPERVDERDRSMLSVCAIVCGCVRQDSSGRAKADGRGELCSVRRKQAADGRGKGEAGNAASSSDARGAATRRRWLARVTHLHIAGISRFLADGSTVRSSRGHRVHCIRRV